MRQAQRVGLSAVEKRTDEQPWLEDLPEVWDLFSVGVFEDDVAIVNEVRTSGRSPRAVCSVAAGVQDFATTAGSTEGVFGIAQWFPGRDEQVTVGPTEPELVEQYRRLLGAKPDYPAIQAAATAIIAVHCAEIAGSVRPDELWAAAKDFKGSTLFGPFGIDPDSGVQTRQAPVLVQWHANEQQLVR